MEGIYGQQPGQSPDQHPYRYNAKMRGLAYKAKTQLEETGANNLYLAIGSLMWELDCPLLRNEQNPLAVNNGASQEVGNGL